MTELSMPFDAVEIAPNVYDREYNALEFAKYLGGLVETGVMKGALQELKLSNTGANMQTVMATGIAYIAVNGAVHYYENDSPLTLTHDTESIGLNRIDRIVLRLDLNTSARQIKAHIKKGVAAANPVAPALTRNELVYELSVGQVKIVGGQTFIASNAITKEVGNEALCPYATSKIVPNYNDSTLQAVLNKVNGHVDSPVLHTFYGTAIGVNDKTIALDNVITSYVDGMAVVFKNSTANTGAVKLNVNGLGAKPVRKPNGRDLSNADLSVNGIYSLRYNASTGNFILQGEGGYRLEPGSAIISRFDYFGTTNTWMTPIGPDKIVGTAGRFRVSYSFSRNGGTNWPAHAQIYKNGTPYSQLRTIQNGNVTLNYTEDLDLEIGDKFNIYIRVESDYDSTSCAAVGTVGIHATIS